MGDITKNTSTSTSSVGDKPPPAVNDDALIKKITKELEKDEFVKVAGIDTDGVMRGKIMVKEKFLSSLKTGFGMSSAVFGWDMHDELYRVSTSITSKREGYCDFNAIPDLKSFRRIPWEDDVPFFLLNFVDGGESVCADGRNILRGMTLQLKEIGLAALAGTELEFHHFQTPTQDGYRDGGKKNIGAFLEVHAPKQLRPISTGMFSYSATRPAQNKDYFYDLFRVGAKINCHLEALHTESGPGVYEAAIKFTNVEEAADRVTLFKYLAKSLAHKHDITPCFMAKPLPGLPGNSGHIHVSLVDLQGNNAFARSTPDEDALYPDIVHLSDTGRYFLAGLLDALPDIMPMFAPTVNSYKRLVENYWAPITITWGLEDRMSSIRLIAPPVSSAKATRFEVRIPGADLHPHYAMSAILAAGLRGIRKQLGIPVPPTAVRGKENPPERLQNTLETAIRRFKAPDSIAREIFDNDFVDFYAATREHELLMFKDAITDWEVKRYIELI